MKGADSLFRFLTRKWVIRPLILLSAVVLIVWFMPREGKFNYQFEVGKPWKYGLLTAPYDFPIYKDEAVVKAERDSLLASYRPYVAVNEMVYPRMLTQFREDCRGRLKDRFPESWRSHFESLLAAIYKAGVLEPDLYDRMHSLQVEEVMVMREKMATPVSLRSLYTLKSAYHWLLHQDTVLYPVERLQRFDLNVYLQPNLRYDSLKSADVRREMMASVSSAAGMVQSGQKIIDRGEIVNRETYTILESLRQASLKRTGDNDGQLIILAGQVLFVLLLIGSFVVYLVIYRKEYIERRNTMLLIFTMIVSFSVMTFLLVTLNLVNVYILPFAMLPIVLHVLLDSRTAFLAHVTTLLIASVSLHYPHEFILLQLVGGMAAIYSLRELSQRSQLYRVAISVVLTYSLLNFSMELMQENEISAINLNMYLNFLINGVLLLFTYPLLFAMEKIFHFTSNVTLVELSNTNSKLLRRLSEEAPGTFQHTIQVSNLAAAAAEKIGANAQLVRTGALYHDIGKIDNPIFFTENQSGVNPHKQLSYEQSARVVINHVSNGLRIAEKYNLPRSIKDFISTHHGKGTAKYFLISWMNENHGNAPDLQQFMYPGPNPATKETAIMMMADAVEAASRSLTDYSDESITELVNKIVDGQVADGFFKECPITFKEISIVKTVFREKLKSVYHPRVSYPEVKK